MWKKFRPLVITLLLVVVLPASAFYLWHKKNYPYGATHRCSGALATFIRIHAGDHDGRHPSATDFPGKSDVLPLSALLTESPDHLEYVVGKAGDLAAAEKFFATHGYLENGHSSWHYVDGLTLSDTAFALAWDKIPLDHNGGKRDSNPREVIMADGSVTIVNEADWPAFLAKQERLQAEKRKLDL